MPSFSQVKITKTLLFVVWKATLLVLKPGNSKNKAFILTNNIMPLYLFSVSCEC